MAAPASAPAPPENWDDMVGQPLNTDNINRMIAQRQDIDDICPVLLGQPVPPLPQGRRVRLLIYYNLDCNLPRNALFFAGRLQAFEPRATEAAYLLALCYLRMGQYKAAYDSSKNPGSRGTHLGCSYVFAQACLWLEKFGEGVTALERSKTLWSTKSNWNKHTETRVYRSEGY